MPSGLFLGFADDLGGSAVPDLSVRDGPPLLAASLNFRSVHFGLLFQDACHVLISALRFILWEQSVFAADSDVSAMNEVGILRRFPEVG